LSATVVVVLPSSLTLSLQALAFGRSYDFSAALALLMTVVGVAFQMRGSIEKRLERTLFPAKVASRIRLAAFRWTNGPCAGSGSPLDLLCESLSGAFDLDGLYIYVLGNHAGDFELVRAWVGDPVREIATDSPLARWLRKAAEAVIRKEALTADPGAGSEQMARILESNAGRSVYHSSALSSSQLPH
jgi:hypothetical protein